MKKMIIAAITVLTVIATVIGCQVYDSQTNDTLYSAMNALGEGPMTKADYMANFVRDCNNFSDLTADLSSDEVLKGYETVLGYFMAYPDFYTTVKGIVADDTGFTSSTDESNNINKPESVKAWYKEHHLTVADFKAMVEDKDDKYYDKGPKKGELKTPADFESLTVEGYLIGDLYDKQYQLKWDWNSKKGR